MSTEIERKANRERQARWRRLNIEEARRQGREKQARYVAKRRKLTS